jgi:hypothetical protein
MSSVSKVREVSNNLLHMTHAWFDPHMKQYTFASGNGEYPPYLAMEILGKWGEETSGWLRFLLPFIDKILVVLKRSKWSSGSKADVVDYLVDPWDP